MDSYRERAEYSQPREAGQGTLALSGGLKSIAAADLRGFWGRQGGDFTLYQGAINVKCPTRPGAKSRQRHLVSLEQPTPSPWLTLGVRDEAPPGEQGVLMGWLEAELPGETFQTAS
jgi:hypothetical protein